MLQRNANAPFYTAYTYGILIDYSRIIIVFPFFLTILFFIQPPYMDKK